MLDEIKKTKCPECGCNEIGFMKKGSKHCNGHWNEEIQFRCGYTETFSPNSMRIEVSEESCRWSEKLKQKIEIDNEAIVKLLAYIKKLKCSKKLKEKLEREVLYCKIK